MSKIILDCASSNTCQNNKDIVKRMIDEVVAIDTKKHEIIFKWQLFDHIINGTNPLDYDIFDYAYNYAKELGYETTASVFDKPSLDFLLQYNIPMVKIANNRSLDWLIGEIPRKIPVYVSYGSINEIKLETSKSSIKQLLCVSQYPATIEQYKNNFALNYHITCCGYGLSDHTTTWDLFNEYQPEIIEVHYCLDDSIGLDAGPFARRPSQLGEIL